MPRKQDQRMPPRLDSQITAQSVLRVPDRSTIQREPAGGCPKMVAETPA